MKVIAKAIMPNGTNIQIENWNENYDFIPPCSTLATYPISRASHKGSFSPRANETYRFAFDFKSSEEAKQAFENLKNGTKLLADYIQCLDKKEYADCI